MADEQQEIAKLIRSGAYYKEARSWYQAIYLRPIGERTFFIIIMALAGLILLFALTAFVRLTPITARPGILISSNAVDENIPSIVKLRGEKETSNAALEMFYIRAYVSLRESYSAKEAQTASAFVHAHSDPATLANYRLDAAPSNPKSAIGVVGADGSRAIEVTGVTINATTNPPTANVQYTMYDTVNGQSSQRQAKVILSYYYTPLNIKEVIDKDSGETIIQTEDPQFQVVQYAQQPMQ